MTSGRRCVFNVDGRARTAYKEPQHEAVRIPPPGSEARKLINVTASVSDTRERRDSSLESRLPHHSHVLRTIVLTRFAVWICEQCNRRARNLFQGALTGHNLVACLCI